MIHSGIVEKIRQQLRTHLFSGITILLFLLLCLRKQASAQEFGGNPPSVKWSQINNKIVRVIFPAGLDSIALEVADISQRIASISAPSIGKSTRKIDIVLQHLPTFSNGYVSLGPFRSEFYLTPRQNSFELGSLPWHKSLALHEYRHVQQFNNFRKGGSRLAYYVFGQEGQAFANSVAVPDWFWEGDAVYQETLLSRQGRGRLPYFFNGYRSLWASSKNYSWMKLRNGSLRDYVPDHYQLGYLLVNYGYYRYGPLAWKNITADAAAFKGLFYPFQKAFRRHTSQTFTDFRNEALKFYQQENKTSIADSVSAYASNQKHFVSDQLYPQWIGKNRLIYQELSYSRIPAFYEHNPNTGEKRKIRNRGLSTSNYFSANETHIVYSSYVPDPRWGWRNYEAVTLLDIRTGKERRITKGKRYLSPALSENSRQIVAVQSNPDGSNSLHILDSTGKLLRQIPALRNYIYTYPVFAPGDSIVAAVRNMQGEMALGRFSIETGEASWITPFSMNVIAFPSISGDTVFFSRSENDADKLFAAADGNIFEVIPSVSNITTGNYLLSAKNGKYAWSAFTSAGYKIFTGSVSFRAASEESGNIFSIRAPSVLKNLITDEKPVAQKIEKYSAAYRLFNFHSWRPYFNDPEYSYSIVSNNILNTLFTEIYFTYNRNEGYKESGALLSYAGFYPVITGGASYTFDRSFTDTANTTTWNEFNARAGLSVPLQFTHGAFSQALNAGASFNTKQVYYTGSSRDRLDTKGFNYGDFSVSFTNQQQKARQNIYPRIAQAFSARYRRILNNISANQLFLNASFYLPGISQNHSLVFQFAYQQRDTLQQYIFSNGFPISRGYSDIDYPRMWKAGVNYHMPLLYPDVGFGNIVYLLRVRSNAFYDISRIKSLRTQQTFNLDAAGVEIFFDTQWWNQQPVSFGLRYSRLLDAGLLGLNANQWEIVLPVNIFTR